MIKKLSRVEYEKGQLLDQHGSHDPFDLFGIWWDDAILADVPLLDAITLATVDSDGQPDGRIVLLKSFDRDGLVFYTNYHSAKAKQLSTNPKACMVLFWPSLERQIRIRGDVAKISRERSEQYFNSRPLGAKISAWASPQSQRVKSRDALDRAYDEMEKRYGAQVPCPPHWGGYRLRPRYFEFWQGRKSRLHDRICYEMDEANNWLIARLAP